MPSQKPTPCPLRTKFGRNITRLRIAKGYTQEQLAEKIGISARYTQSLEAGEYFPTLPNLVKLRAVLGTEWDQFFEGCR